MLIDKVGGMDLFLLSSGIGFQNTNLNMEVELNTAYTNVEGFIRMVDTAFIYFRKSGGGHLAVISSIAGTKGLGVAPAYSATKRFQNTYIDALEQLSYLQKLNIRFTDIRPGFVATDLLNDICISFSSFYDSLFQNHQILFQQNDICRFFCYINCRIY